MTTAHERSSAPVAGGTAAGNRADGGGGLLIVIVNYRTAELTIGALAALEAEVAALACGNGAVPSRTRATEVRVVVVENGSGDDSAELLQQAIASHRWTWCTLLVSPTNLGFAGGNNLALRPELGAEGGEEGARAGRSEFVVLLNPDTLVRPGAMRELIEFMRRHPDVGIAGSRLEDPDGTAQRSAFRFPTPWTELNDTLRMRVLEKCVPQASGAFDVRDDPHPTDWVAGASMIIRPAVFDAIGLLDEGYFVYYEEVDFCLRARRGGWPCWYVPASRVVHLVGMASQVNNPNMKPKRRPRFWFDARKRYFRRNQGWLTALLADAAWLGGYAIFRVRRWCQRRPTGDPPWFFWDFLRYTYFAGPAR
jgi:GT2 family glycosyltransferase